MRQPAPCQGKVQPHGLSHPGSPVPSWCRNRTQYGAPEGFISLFLHIWGALGMRTSLLGRARLKVAWGGWLGSALRPWRLPRLSRPCSARGALPAGTRRCPAVPRPPSPGAGGMRGGSEQHRGESLTSSGPHQAFVGLLGGGVLWPGRWRREKGPRCLSGAANVSPKAVFFHAQTLLVIVPPVRWGITWRRWAQSWRKQQPSHSLWLGAAKI